jgi:hypothetical protein
MSLILAAFHIGLVTIAVAAATLLLVDLAALGSGFLQGARPGRILLGLTPITIVMGFAIVYSCWAIGKTPAVIIGPPPGSAANWVDTLLLSFDVASFGGFLDLVLQSHIVRWTAYLEMLLMGSFGGITLFRTATIVWGAVEDLVRRPVEGG